MIFHLTITQMERLILFQSGLPINMNQKDLIRGNRLRQTLSGPWEHGKRLIVPCEFRAYHQTVGHCQRQESPESSIEIY